MTAPSEDPLRTALRKWLFPLGFNRPDYWSLTNEGAKVIALAASPAKVSESETLRVDPSRLARAMRAVDIIEKRPVEKYLGLATEIAEAYERATDA